MTGSQKVIQAIQIQVAVEMTAMHQYIINRQACLDWGREQLAAHYAHEIEEERKHLDRLLERVFFLEGDATQQVGASTQVIRPTDVPAMLARDLELEREAVARYNQAATLALAEGDHGSQHLFTDILEDEEAAVNKLENWLLTIRDLGLTGFLLEQFK